MYIYMCVCTGVGGYDGDGDITKPDNLVAFQDYVLEQTEGRGVHFVMGDGVRMYIYMLWLHAAKVHKKWWGKGCVTP